MWPAMPGKLPLSVLLLARDETRRLEALLPTLAAAREVVMVWDAQGAPQTRATAERLGARVFTRELAGFGAQRQYALEQCREPWVLWLDADEWLDSAAWAALERAVAGVPRESGFTLTRRSWFLGRRIRFCGWQGERILRVFRRERAGFDDAAVHERVQVEGAIGRLEGTIEHHSYETWEDCARKLRAYAHAGALPGSRGARRAGLLDVVFRPPLRFLRMYVLQLGFLDGAHGLVLCALAATQVFLKYAERWASRGGRGRAEGRA
jgi:(heptosyl)LPS beta-1,4-glucosyltransferase